jgi:aspartyl protease family protein
MSGGETTSLISALVCLMLVGSALVSRRLPVGQTLKMALAWVGIFAFGFLIFSFRSEFQGVWNRVKAEAIPGGTVAEDGTLRVRADENGHFYVDAEVNGRSTRFMVDSGATVTSMSADAARAANVPVDETGFSVMTQTANGMAEARRARVDRLRVGPIARDDFPIHVSETLGDTNLIGMNFLSTLKGWRVEGRELILNP